MEITILRTNGEKDILIIEDSVATAEILDHFLEKPDLVLLDIRMPTMDGMKPFSFDFLKELVADILR